MQKEIYSFIAKYRFKKRVTSGLNLVFSFYDRAIILEDDCIPNESFFIL